MQVFLLLFAIVLKIFPQFFTAFESSRGHSECRGLIVVRLEILHTILTSIVLEKNTMFVRAQLSIIFSFSFKSAQKFLCKVFIFFYKDLTRGHRASRNVHTSKGHFLWFFVGVVVLVEKLFLISLMYLV